MHPAKLVDVLKQAESMVELIIKDEVKSAPASSINVAVGPSRRFAAVEAGLDELKAVKNALGGTLNDVVLAALSGGLRRLLIERGEDPPDGGLRAMVPVNIRDAGQQLGNRISSLFVHLPVAEPDPLRRYALATANAEDIKHGSQSQGSSALISIAGLAPPVLHSVLAQALFASRLFNVTVTNVPGPQQPLYAFGARMEAIFPLVPLAADHTVGVAVLSYDGRVFFGLNADRHARARSRRAADGDRGLDRGVEGAGSGAERGERSLSPRLRGPLKHVAVGPISPERFKGVLSPEAAIRLDETIAEAHHVLDGRAVWSVNSTARGGGVAELLSAMIAYTRGAGIDARWVVMRGEPDFFALTKHLHNMLHGVGDGGPPKDPGAEVFSVSATTRRRRSSSWFGPATWCSPTTRRRPGCARRCAKPACGWSGVATWAWTSPTTPRVPHGASCSPMSRRPRPSSSRARCSCHPRSIRAR